MPDFGVSFNSAFGFSINGQSSSGFHAIIVECTIFNATKGKLYAIPGQMFRYHSK